MDQQDHQLKRLHRDLAYRGEIVDLYKDTVALPDGKIQEWDYVHHKKGCGAAVVPILPDGRILMVRQYRPAIDEIVLELPAGGKDSPREDTIVTAARELEEETGYTAGKIEPLASIQTAVAWTNEYTDIYLATELSKSGSQCLDEAEEIRVQAYPLKELLTMIRAWQLRDGKSVAGVLAYATLKLEER